MDFTAIIAKFAEYGPFAALFVLQLLLGYQRDMANTKSARESIDALGGAFNAYVTRWEDKFDAHDAICKNCERNMALIADRLQRERER
jgi:hypothetical protein